MSLLKRYFARPSGRYEYGSSFFDFDTIKYIEYFRHFRLGTWNEAAGFNQVDGVTFFAEHAIPEGEGRKLVIKRKNNEHLARLVAARPSEGERFYIRVLLQHRSARSFEELRTVDGFLHESFQTAAVSLGLFAGEREAEYALLEAI